MIEQSEIICEIQVCKSSDTKIFAFHGLPHHKVYHHEKEKW